MTTLQTSDIRQPITADSTIEFRVSRPGLPRRRLKLVGSRYTIGSGMECSVRLDDSSVRPTHAVLVKDETKVRLRAFGAPIVVNGRAVADSELYVGDRFLIGEYEFELSLGPIAEVPSPTVKPQEVHRETPPVLSGKLRPQDSKVVPRRRVSFASQMKFVDTDAINAVDTEADVQASSEVHSQPEHEPTVSAHEQIDSAQADAAQIAPELCETVVESPFKQAVAADLPSSDLPSSEAVKGRPANAELFDQYRAILANERRWQERSKRQIERFRQREQRSAAQIEALKSAQEAAERRARGAEDAVQGLKQQVTELAGRLSAVTSTVMPGLEQRLNQQYEESVVANRQYQSLMESLRGRLDFLQSTLTEVQAETEDIRQQTVANREDQQEFAASTDTLEQALQKMAEDYQAERVEAEAKVEHLRQSLYQTSLKLSDLTGQLEETRQNGHGLGALVQQLRSSLQNAQTEAQRFATFEQIDEVMRLLKANDQRISQLTEEYDSQSSQLQQECEALRQKLEDSEHLANKAIAAASDALNQALEQRHVLETLVENVQHAVVQQPTAETATETPTVLKSAGALSELDEAKAAVVDAESSEPQVNTNEYSAEDSFGTSSEPACSDNGVSEEQNWDATYLYDPAAHQDEVSEVSWLETDETEPAQEPRDDASAVTENAADDDNEEVAEVEDLDYLGQPKSLSQSAFHLPLEIEAPAETRSPARPQAEDYAIRSLQALRATNDHEAEAVEQAQDDADEFPVDATYQYDPASDDSFGTFRYDDTQKKNELNDQSVEAADPLEPAAEEIAAEKANNEEIGEDYNYQVTAYLDSDLSAIQVGQHTAASCQQAEENSVNQSAENLADEEESDDYLLSNSSMSVSKSGPRSAAEVLASLGISIDESDEEEAADDNAPGADLGHPLISQSNAYEPTRSGAKSTEGQLNGLRSSDVKPQANESLPAAAAVEEQAEEEESIEAYMNRLLRRVQGQSEAEAAPAPVEPKAQIVEPVRDASRITQTVQPEKQTSTLSSSAVMESPYVPRSQAPEKTSSMAAMRELANSSARTAIAASARRKMSNEVLFKYGLFGMGLLAGGAVLLGTRFEFGPWMVIALCCFGLAVFFLLEGVSLRRQLQEAETSSGAASEEQDEE